MPSHTDDPDHRTDQKGGTIGEVPTTAGASGLADAPGPAAAEPPDRLNLRPGPTLLAGPVVGAPTGHSVGADTTPVYGTDPVTRETGPAEAPAGTGSRSDALAVRCPLRRAPPVDGRIRGQSRMCSDSSRPASSSSLAWALTASRNALFSAAHSRKRRRMSSDDSPSRASSARPFCARADSLLASISRFRAAATASA